MRLTRTRIEIRYVMILVAVVAGSVAGVRWVASEPRRPAKSDRLSQASG